MSTEKADEQEAPGVRINKTDEEDTSGHKFTAKSGDPDSGAEQPSVFTRATPDEDDTEGHKFTAKSGDPDFGAEQPSVFTRATPDEDDTEGHVKYGGR